MEKALIYFTRKQWPFWRIERGGKLVDNYEGDDFEESSTALRDAMELLPVGTYTLKVWQKKKGEAGQSQIDFQVKPESVTKGQMPQNGQNAGMDLNAIREEIRAEERRKLQLEYRVEKVEKAVETVIQTLDELKMEFAKLTDDDESNDASAMEKIGQFAQHAPGLMEMFKTLKTA